MVVNSKPQAVTMASDGVIACGQKHAQHKHTSGKPLSTLADKSPQANPL